MRRFLVATVVVFLTVISAPVGFAHGGVVDSFPQQYSNNSPIPTQVWIQFDGNLQILDEEVINTIEVVDSTGLTVSFGDPVIEGGKILTKVSGQSAPGVFTVNYRILSEDAHPVTDSYTFNASPDYQETKPLTSVAPKTDSKLSIGGIVMAVFLVIFAIGYLAKRKNEKR